MTRPYALFALLLAILPWLSYFTPRNKPQRMNFAPMRLLANAQRKRTIYKRRVLLACSRSAIIVAVVLLWLNPFADNETTPNEPNSTYVSTRAKRILIVDAASAIHNEPTVAEYLALAIQPQINLPRTHSGAMTAQWQNAENDFTLVDYATWALTREHDAERFDLILFAQPSGLSQLDSQKLLAARRNGAAILIWVGLDLQAQTWQNWLQSHIAPDLEIARLDFSQESQVHFTTTLTPQEQVFRARFPDFKRAGLDAPPIRCAWICRGANAQPILRDKVHNAPILTQISDRAYWCAVSPQRCVGELAFLPAFPSFVQQTIQSALDDDLNFRPKKTKTHAKLALWLILACAMSLEFLLLIGTNAPVGRGDGVKRPTIPGAKRPDAHSPYNRE
ncbi:MAG: hypothetical protein Q4G03_11190 [Planctomycetia bacterium]|nr:hypothetical protein [Planctomycetia bacterium]